MKFKGKVWAGKECEGIISMYVSAEIRIVVKATQKKVFRVREKRGKSGTFWNSYIKRIQRYAGTNSHWS